MGREWYHYWGSSSSGGGSKKSSSKKTKNKKHNNNNKGDDAIPESISAAGQLSPPRILYKSSNDPLQPPSPPALPPTTAGCMTAVFQILDFHPLQLCLHPHLPNNNSNPDESDDKRTSTTSSIRGTEAPRNSLETDLTASTASSSSIKESDHTFNFPTGMRIKTNTRRDNKLLKKTDDDDDFRFSTETTSISSPATSTTPRTPTLVAKLMGLDHLPDQQHQLTPTTTPRLFPVTPTSSSSTTKRPPTTRTNNNNLYIHSDVTGSSPRRLSISARKSDADGFYNHRFSLQVNNRDHNQMMILEEHPRHSCSAITTTTRRTKDVENNNEEQQTSVGRSPRYYAKQILKQVKESVIKRRFGGDITNTITSSEQPQHQRTGTTQTRGEYYRRDEHLLVSNDAAAGLTKGNKIKKEKSHERRDGSDDGSFSSSLRSPTLRAFLEGKKSKQSQLQEQQPPSDQARATTNTTCQAEEDQSERAEETPVIVSKKPKSPDLQPKQQRDSEQKQRLESNNRKGGGTSGSNWSGKTRKSGGQAVVVNNGIDGIRNKKEEQFVRTVPATSNSGGRGNQFGLDKMHWKTTNNKPLSSDLVHHGTHAVMMVPSSLAAYKKSSSSADLPSSAASAVTTSTRIDVHKQDIAAQVPSSSKVVAQSPKPTSSPQLSSDLSWSYTDSNSQKDHYFQPTPHLLHHQQHSPATTTAVSTASTTRAEFHYISRILRRTGIDRDTPVSSFTKWFSSSHPLDPSIFILLEKDEQASPSSSLHLHCNRRLIFDLVDEILADILRRKLPTRGLLLPSSSTTPTPQGQVLHGFQLMRTIWTTVKSYPRAHCKILQDIDELVEMDLKISNRRRSSSGVDEEAHHEDVLLDIEEELMQGLILDTAMAIVRAH